MKPITFHCEQSFALAPEAIAAQILDVTKWPEFQGYGPLPGIKSAPSRSGRPKVVGSRIRVADRDGSTHVEEITEWRPQRLTLRMTEFSAPLSRLATSFEETWEFKPQPNGTDVVHNLLVQPKSLLERLPVRLIAWFLKQAIGRHLRQLAASAQLTRHSSTRDSQLQS